MPKIFISYRDEDAGVSAELIYHQLVRKYGSNNIYLAKRDLSIGVDYEQELAEKLNWCQLLIVVIGKRWLDVMGTDGLPCLRNTQDWVRKEIERSQARDIPIFPLLVENVILPSQEELAQRQLPESILTFLRLQALNIRGGQNLDGDMQLLARTINKHFPRLWRRSAVIITLVAILITSTAVAFNAHWRVSRTPPSRFSR